MFKLAFSLTVVFCSFSLAFGDTVSQWKEKRGDHFIVYYTGGNKNFASEVLYQAEKNYVRIANYFGYSRRSNFWTWDNRVKIFIYPDSSDYLKATGMQPWSKGMADYTQKYIATYVESEVFLEDILPHEMAHLIFRDFVGFKGEAPLWLDEGVAQWAEIKKRKITHEQIRAYARSGKLLSLRDMTQMDIRALGANDIFRFKPILWQERSPALVALRGKEAIQLFYIQAASLVSFLIGRFGVGRFAAFCRALRDGASLEEALRSGYVNIFSSADDLQEVWLEYIKQEQQY